MIRFRKLVCMIGCLLPVHLFAQMIDNTVSFRTIQDEKYFRFNYDNDFFTATDRYYSQGINFEYVNPALRKNPLSIILFHINNTHVKYGMAVEHIAFTPSSIRHDEILYHDRPFAACLLLKSFSVSVDTVHRERLSSVLSIGVLGPAAFGAGMQKTIHHWLNNIQPLGWQNQIQNDVVLNYELAHERYICSYNDFSSLNTNVAVNAGTLTDKVSLGFTLNIGKYNSPFSGSEKKSTNNFQFYFYSQSLASYNFYDATLQGGLFNHSSPYTLCKSEITRMTFVDNLGMILTFKKIYLEYSQSILTREFDSGKTHRWGGIRIGLTF